MEALHLTPCSRFQPDAAAPCPRVPSPSLPQSKLIGSTVTLPKRLMPLKLSSVKKALHALVTGRSPQVQPSVGWFYWH